MISFIVSNGLFTNDSVLLLEVVDAVHLFLYFQIGDPPEDLKVPNNKYYVFFYGTLQ